MQQSLMMGIKKLTTIETMKALKEVKCWVKAQIIIETIISDY